jgi:hypothetical protein
MGIHKHFIELRDESGMHVYPPLDPMSLYHYRGRIVINFKKILESEHKALGSEEIHVMKITYFGDEIH